MKPARWFVRTWTVDPAGEGPDEEHDRDALSEQDARDKAKRLRMKGRTAGAFERRSMCVIDGTQEAPLWEWEETRIDEKDEDLEFATRAGKVTP